MSKKVKLFVTLAAASMLMGSTTSISNAAYFPETDFKRAIIDIKVLYNARQINTDVKAENVNGTVFVPFTAVGKALGAQMALSEDGKEISFAKGNKKVKVTIGSKKAVVNGAAVELNAAPYIKTSRTMVPTRFISEQLGEKVEWDPTVQFVWIGHKDVPHFSDLGDPVELAPYKDYFPSSKMTDFIIKTGSNSELKTVQILQMSDFPFMIGSETYYRMDKTTNAEGTEAIQTIVYDNARLGRAYYLLDNGKPPKYRVQNKLRMVNGKTFHYNLVGDEADKTMYNDINYKALKLKTIDYIGIDAYGFVDSLLFIKNEIE